MNMLGEYEGPSPEEMGVLKVQKVKTLQKKQEQQLSALKSRVL